MSNITAYYDQAMTTLAKIGLSITPKPSAASMVIPLIERLEKIDPDNALSIARTMQVSGEFNEIVLKEISTLDIGGRFIQIAEQFDSIRDDTSQMVNWMEDSKLDWREKIQMRWMHLRRGTVTERFEDIKKTFTDVIASTNQHIAKETSVLSGYQQFRFAIKEAEAASAVILGKAQARLAVCQNTGTQAEQSIVSAPDDQAKSKLELQRDVALAEIKAADQDYQIAKDLFENLKISYNTSEVVFARLQQNLDMKQRIQQRSITFFGTNEIVFTALAAAFTSTQGLAESTHALDQLQTGVNKSIEALASIGTKQLEASVRAGYGSTISAQSIKLLADSIIEYQSNLTGLVTQLREEATQNATEIEQHTNHAKERFIALTTKA